MASWPPPEAGREGGPAPAPAIAQTVSTPNFTGATLSDTGAFPPDTMGTVGPTQYIVAVNGRVRRWARAPSPSPTRTVRPPRPPVASM